MCNDSVWVPKILSIFKHITKQKIKIGERSLFYLAYFESPVPDFVTTLISSKSTF